LHRAGRPAFPAVAGLHAAGAPGAQGCRLRHGSIRTRLRFLVPTLGKTAMAWTTPTLVEICIGLEINGYLPAEF
jgi:coenzyme PQQ precursor peptide PqqA